MCDLTCVQDVWQDSDYTQLTVLTGILQDVFIEDLRDKIATSVMFYVNLHKFIFHFQSTLKGGEGDRVEVSFLFHL